MTIELPKLVDRLEDLDELIDYFTSIFAQDNREIVDLKPIIKSKYINYGWPGNIRELRNIIERYIILGEKYENDVNLHSNNLSERNVISLPL